MQIFLIVFMVFVSLMSLFAILVVLQDIIFESGERKRNRGYSNSLEKEKHR